MPVTSFVFDKDLINPNGVWEVHHRYPDSNSKISTSNVASFSKYPDFFPNLSKGAFTLGEKLKPPVTIEGHANALYGEVGFEVPTPFGKVGFSAGVEGKLAGYSKSSGSKYNVSETTFLDDKNLNLGGGIDLFAGIEYRRGFDLQNGKFTNSDELKGGFPPLFEVSDNSFNKPSSVRFGLTDFKLAMGLGFNAGAYLSFNEQLKLSGFEKVLYDALINKLVNPQKHNLIYEQFFFRIYFDIHLPFNNDDYTSIYSNL
jgi:hypothetical protein